MYDTLNRHVVHPRTRTYTKRRASPVLKIMRKVHLYGILDVLAENGWLIGYKISEENYWMLVDEKTTNTVIVIFVEKRVHKIEKIVGRRGSDVNTIINSVG